MAPGFLNKAGRSVPQASCPARCGPEGGRKGRNPAWGVVAPAGRVRLPCLEARVERGRGSWRWPCLSPADPDGWKHLGPWATARGPPQDESQGLKS